jgi:hypothetical protein
MDGCSKIEFSSAPQRWFFFRFAEVLLCTRLLNYLVACLVAVWLFSLQERGRGNVLLYCLQLAIAPLKATMRNILISLCNKLYVVCCRVERLMRF